MGIDDGQSRDENDLNIFKGVTYYLVGDISTEVKSFLDKHGAKMDSYLSEMVSHVIADTTEADDYSEAKELFELPIVSSDWVLLSVRCGKQLPLEVFALEGRLFSKVVATPYQLETQDALHVWGMIKYHGGKCQLHLDEKTTHLITASMEGAKYASAIEKSSIKIVTPDWVVDTVTKKEPQDETVYHPRLIEYPKPEPSPPPPQPPQLQPAMTQDSGLPFENCHSLGMVGVAGASKSPPGEERMDIDFPNAKEVLARKISSRMGGSKTPPTTPEKAVPLSVGPFHPISQPGNQTPAGVSVPSPPVPAMGLRPRMDIVRNTLRNITNRAVTPMNVPMRPALPTGAAKMGPMIGMGMPPHQRPPPPDYPFPPRMMGGAGMPGHPHHPPQAGPPNAQAPVPGPTHPTPRSTGPRYFGHDPKENVPPHLCLLGCVFIIVDYHNVLGSEEITTWKKVIEQHGGQMESSYSNRITHVICCNQKSDIFRMAQNEGKRVVTAFWLNDCLMQKKLLPPWQALHLPLSFNSEKPGFNQMISVTNFDGEERTRLKQMINAIGAKYTGYMTHHNSALICKKPGGMKFEKAKEWRIAVVNVQWLSDLVLGNMDALRLPVHVRYLQVGQGNEFHMDLNRVSHLLVGWKSPVRISKETWKKYGNPLLPPPGQENSPMKPSPPKKSKVDCSIPPPDVETSTPKVMFTLYPKTVVNRLAGIVKQLGGVVVTNPRHCSHLVCPELARTIKFFIAISSTRHIVTKEWLEESAVQERFIGEFDYALKDGRGEKTLGCDLAESLRRAQARPLLQGFTFHITPGVTPPVCELKSIIENAGGTIVKLRPSVKAITASMDEQENPKIVVITCLGDLHLCQDLIFKNIPIYNPELVLTGVMRQELSFRIFRITRNIVS